MKKYVLDFIRRGLIASGFGPLLLAGVYFILQYQGKIELLTAKEVCLGIFSLWALAFIAGGMNVVYQIERLPLMAAIFLHGSVLYLSYMGTYLINDWMEWGKIPVLAFTVIFGTGYIIIWLIIYSVTKRRTETLNQMLNTESARRRISGL